MGPPGNSHPQTSLRTCTGGLQHLAPPAGCPEQTSPASQAGAAAPLSLGPPPQPTMARRPGNPRGHGSPHITPSGTWVGVGCPPQCTRAGAAATTKPHLETPNCGLQCLGPARVEAGAAMAGRQRGCQAGV